jgi:hypothetical protein
MTQYIWHRGRHEETILGAPVFPLYCYVLWSLSLLFVLVFSYTGTVHIRKD